MKVSFIEQQTAFNPEIYYVISVLTSEKLSDSQKIEQLKAYAYALGDDTLRHEIDALDILKSRVKKEVVSYLLRSNKNPEFIDSAVSSLEKQFNEFYYRIIFVAFTVTEIFSIKSLTQLVDFRDMHKSIRIKLLAYATFYTPNKRVIERINTIVDSYVAETEGGETQ